MATRNTRAIVKIYFMEIDDTKVCGQENGKGETDQRADDKNERRRTQRKIDDSLKKTSQYEKSIDKGKFIVSRRVYWLYHFRRCHVCHRPRHLHPSIVSIAPIVPIASICLIGVIGVIWPIAINVPNVHNVSNASNVPIVRIKDNNQHHHLIE